MQDAEEMTLGMWIDYIFTYNQMHEPEKGEDGKAGKKVITRKATQADYDAF